MTKYSKQIEATRAAHMASRALADAAIVRLDKAWDSYVSGDLTIDQLRSEAHKIVKFSYNEAASVGKALTQRQSGIVDWNPIGDLKDSAYLESLLLDVDRNIEDFKNSDRDEKAGKRLKFRVGLSAITASQRGFTDAQLVHYGELQAMGHRVTKLWTANFVNNEPCVDCISLHGTVVPFDTEFPVPTLMRTAVYRDLQGPPLHVRCKCVMVVLITSADNIFDKIPTNRVDIPTTMSTDSVKSLPRRIFDSIVKVLRTITGGSNDKS